MNVAEFNHFLEVATAISKEKNYDRLLTRILTVAMDITNCDGGTLYTCEKDCLEFKIMRTVSLNIYKGEDGSPVHDMPPVPYAKENICAKAVLENRTIIINDIWKCGKYNFSGAKRYDSITGYHTRSMIVVPMENHYGDIIGVLQLINALDENGQVVPFQREHIIVVESLASLAAVSFTNRNYMEEIKALFDSFVRTISAAIDERTPYNASHSKNMVLFCEKFIDYINEHDTILGKFSVNRREQLMTSIWLHDIGKIVIPTRIMNKSTRLGLATETVKDRFEKMMLYCKIDYLEGKIDQPTYEKNIKELETTVETIERANPAGPISDEDCEFLTKAGKKQFVKSDGTVIPWLTEEEVSAITVRQGTLSPKERSIMEGHVTMTEKLLDEIRFTREYDHVRQWASNHHEFLNGSGYTRGLTADDVPYEVRILTMIDVFEALTAKDRPYKPPVTKEKALLILRGMAQERKLDCDIVELFIESEAWKIIVD